MNRRIPVLIMLAALVISANGAYADTTVVEKSRVSTEGACGATPDPMTLEQLEKIHSIKSRYEDSGDARHAELHKLHRAMGDAMSHLSIDKSAVMSLQGKISAIEASEGEARTQMMIELHDVLTPEQKSKMRKAFLEHEGPPHMPGMHGPMGMMPPPPHGMMPPPPFGHMPGPGQGHMHGPEGHEGPPPPPPGQ